MSRGAPLASAPDLRAGASVSNRDEIPAGLARHDQLQDRVGDLLGRIERRTGGHRLGIGSAGSNRAEDADPCDRPGRDLRRDGSRVPIVADVIPAMSTHYLTAADRPAQRGFFVAVIDDVVLPALQVGRG